MIAAFFDIDGTIYRNSLLTEHFKKLVKYELIDINEYESNIKNSFTLWDERKGDYDNYLQDLTSVYVEAIKGLSLQYNNFIADQVVDLKGNRVYKYSRDRVQWHKSQGHKVIFISGSPDFLVKRMAEKMGADDYCGSCYLTAENKLTGEVKPMWDTPNKIKAIGIFCEKYNITLEDSYAYGDTNGDYGMLSLVGHPKAVNPSKELINKIKSNSDLSRKCEIIVERKDVIYHTSISSIDIEV
ncbi:MAG: HAD-IB family hydrolase [Fusobacteriaceae bacterium]